MIRLHRHSKSLLLAGFIAGVGTPCAFAVEADAVGERLQALLEKQQIVLTYDAASMAGSDVTLEGVSARSTVGGEAIALGTVTLEDVIEEEDGDYRVGTIALDAFEHRSDNVTVSLTDATMTGLVLPPDIDADPFAGAMRYERFAVARVDVDGEDGPLGSLENAYAELSEEDDVLQAVGAAERFSLNLEAIADDRDATALLDRLGYSQISGSGYMEGSWQPSDGRVRLTRYEAVIEDAGTLALMVDFAGYTPEFVRMLDEMARQSADGGQNNSAQGMAMLGMMQQLTFHGLRIHFTDDSLTRKVLDYVAEREGSTPEDVITQMTAVIPLQLSNFLGEQAATDIATAVGTFLKNPQNLEISAMPENPVPFAMVMGAAMGAPEMLVQQLGLSVKANQ
ncbi:hypothetical protein [Chelativorans sp. M5D2P16]|uniref:hypothetical protein n=1 Tax=Chelativorans sp. M5D2P16 TaxID=3095678 RepID=UPI002ACABE8A|nr:hypothetical protein [Chelativorans sp. M5D2P16]MDZ5696868.1 hypothetical protein [Chelativorans sp. M5D2P16]